MLWACLLLSSLSLDVYARAQSPDDALKPFAVVTGGRTPRIVSANAGALDAGIRPEQLVSSSLALSPELVMRERDPTAEAAALAAVATWSTQFTPAVSLAPPDAVLLEIGGSLRLFGGLPKLKALLCSGVRELGYALRFTLAPTPAAALLLARADTIEQERSSVRVASLSKALAPLPLSLTDADPAVLATLATAGITTFGQACALPRDALAKRAGAGFLALLDRAQGLAPDPRPAFAPPPRYRGTLDLPVPVDNVEALTFATNRLVHELCGWLVGRGLGIVEMSLTLAHERYVGVKTGIPATEARFALATPAREPAHLLAVLRERLARVALPASVETLTLESAATAPLSGRNLGLLAGDESAAAVPLLDRLRARLGDDAVTLVAAHAEHRPERAWREGLPRFDAPLRPPRAGNAPPGIASTMPPRPLWLLAEPAPLGALAGMRPWVLKDGPERIESGWWDGADVRRDYYVAVTPRGETAWIYRDHRNGIDDGEWYVHGIFA